MKANAFALAGLAGSFVLAGTASAEFVGVSISEYMDASWSANGYDATGLTTYRLYAEFTGEAGDGVLSAFGLTGLPLSVNSSNGYHNDPLGGMTAPLDLTGVGIWNNQWDTYVTIGTTQATGDATTLSPGFDTITQNLSIDWVNTNGGWFVTPADPQATALDAENRLLLAQFVKPAADGTADFFGTINLLLFDGTNREGIAFSTVPAPGALALLGLAGLAGTRRRRA